MREKEHMWGISQTLQFPRYGKGVMDLIVSPLRDKDRSSARALGNSVHLFCLGKQTKKSGKGNRNGILYTLIILYTLETHCIKIGAIGLLSPGCRHQLFSGT